jgi:CHAD domain-containing protein
MVAESPKTMAELALRTFAGLGAALFGYEASARTGDVDGVHDMRVTTRRLRVALSNFAPCLERELRRELKLRFEQLADALGRVRDLDVMLEALVSLKSALPPSRHAMTAELAVRLRRRRRYHLRKLNEYFDGADYSGLKETYARVLEVLERPLPHDQLLNDGKTIQDQETIAF